jgi:hypothetical protein
MAMPGNMMVGQRQKTLIPYLQKDPNNAILSIRRQTLILRKLI